MPVTPAWAHAASKEAQALDVAVYAAVAATPTPTLDPALQRLSAFADHSKLWLVVAGGLAAAGGARGRRAAATGLLGIGAASALTNVVLKLVGRRRRPDRTGAAVPLGRQVPMPRSTSFPSGHSASAFAFAAAAGHVIPAAGGPLRLLAAVVAYSRVHTGVHYPADVVVGALVGASAGAAVAALGGPAVSAPARSPDLAGEFRYGAVLLLMICLLVFIIVAPSADWAYAVAIALEAAALMVVIATSRERTGVRRARALTLGTVGVGVVVAVAAGAVPTGAVSLVGGALALAIPLALVGGLLRLVRTRGVTLQVVAGALAIYVLIGLMFAWTVGVAAKWGSHAYFASGTDGTESSRLYYSFTVLTTTGFGDFTPAEPVGRALAVIEMLTGQIYLVTVIGILVGNLAARARAS